MIQRPRRLVALVSLLLSSTAAVSSAHAQGKADYDSSKQSNVPRQPPQKAPLDMAKERQLWLYERACHSSVSSWVSTGGRVICTDFIAAGKTESKGHLFLEDRAFVIAPGHAVVDGRNIGAKCELDITFTVADGLNPVLVCEFRYADLERQPVRVLADGAKVGEFQVTDRYQSYDLGPAFGWDSKRMTAVRELEVILAFQGKDVTLFKARLSDPTGDIDALKQAVNSEDAIISFYAGQNPTAPAPARKGCFLTEACCAEVGLADDCFELTALRRYRDHVLAASPGGAAEIRLYYALAPALLGALQAEPSKRHLLRLYYTHILPCAVLAAFGLHGAVHRRYADMMVSLCDRWAPDYLRLVQRVSRHAAERVSLAK
jgi:hypothetical protein